MNRTRIIHELAEAQRSIAQAIIAALEEKGPDTLILLVGVVRAHLGEANAAIEELRDRAR